MVERVACRQPGEPGAHVGAFASADSRRRPGIFPRARDAWLAAGGDRIENVDIARGDHYLAGRPDLQMRVADEIAAFAEAL